MDIAGSITIEMISTTDSSKRAAADGDIRTAFNNSTITTAVDELIERATADGNIRTAANFGIIRTAVDSAIKHAAFCVAIERATADGDIRTTDKRAITGGAAIDAIVDLTAAYNDLRITGNLTPLSAAIYIIDRAAEHSDFSVTV